MNMTSFKLNKKTDTSYNIAKFAPKHETCKEQASAKVRCFLLPIIISCVAVLIMGCKKEKIPMQNIEYGTHPRQKMDISLPPNADQKHIVPVILCIHGGSWVSGDKTDFDWLKNDINSINCAYVSINYRLLQDNVTYKQMLNDIDAAISYLKTHAEAYHLKTDKLAMIGSSAGAHLALLYAYSTNSPIRVACVSSQVGPADFLDSAQLQMSGLAHLDALNKLTGTAVTSTQITNPNFVFPEAWSLASPVYHVSSTTPPTVLAYGVKDLLVSYSNALRLNEKLTEFGIEHHLITFPNSGHTLNQDPDKTEEYKQVIYDYLTRHLLQ
jgi:acetyl esterase/lipase